MNFFDKFNKLKIKYKDNKSIKISLLLGIISILFIFVGGSYAFIFKSAYTSSLNTISAGNLVITFEKYSDVISINGAVPTPDEIGLESDVSYDFTLKNTGSINAKYKISLINNCVVGNTYTVDGVSTKADVCIPTNYIKAGISENYDDFKVIKADSDGNLILDSNAMDRNMFNFYSLKLWLDYDTPNEYNLKDKNVIMSVKIQLYSEQTTEGNLDTSGANIPFLAENMVPVYYDSKNDVWKKADSNNSDKNNQWYDYDNKMWANAITVTSTSRDTYLNAKAGTEISMNDINTMWVWIPRYKYTYFNSNTPQEIQIEFESDFGSTGTIKCTDNVSGSGSTSETCTDSENGSLKVGQSTYTHPAFTFGKQYLLGIWVGKFENSATVIPTETSTDESTIIIKPNVESLRYKSISYMFRDARQMEASGNAYGFKQNGNTTFNWNGTLTGDTNNIDTHMMKNMEWGAVAYLYHSKYGRCNNGSCEEITINNCSNFITGIGADTVSADCSATTCTTDKNKYNGTSGVKASTTGNIYGVYDMSGGTMKFVMGNMVNSSGAFYSSSADFNVTPQSKYYDSYSYDASSSATYARGRLGDATVEMAPTGYTNNWYSDYAFFPSDLHLDPWFTRGGDSIGEIYAGIFSFNTINGKAFGGVTSRTVLTVSNLSLIQ